MLRGLCSVFLALIEEVYDQGGIFTPNLTQREAIYGMNHGSRSSDVSICKLDSALPKSPRVIFLRYVNADHESLKWSEPQPGVRWLSPALSSQLSDNVAISKSWGIRRGDTR